MVPTPIGIFEVKKEQYLVMKFTGNVRTMRESMQETNGQPDAARADKLAAAHAPLRQAMWTPNDGFAGVTPFKSTEEWLVRGFMFYNLKSNRWVKTVGDFVSYLERDFKAAGVTFPSPTPTTWNLGDPSSYNWGSATTAFRSCAISIKAPTVHGGSTDTPLLHAIRTISPCPCVRHTKSMKLLLGRRAFARRALPSLACGIWLLF